MWHANTWWSERVSYAVFCLYFVFFCPAAGKKKSPNFEKKKNPVFQTPKWIWWKVYKKGTNFQTFLQAIVPTLN